jgi:hypothetical protein
VPSTDAGEPDAVGSDRVDVPADATTVAKRYRRLERPVSAAVAVGIATLAGGSYLFVPLVPWLVLAGGLVVAVRAPLFRTESRTRLRTDASPEAVRADFAGPTPPVLPFQWGIADAVRATSDGATYEVSYLFGLRSVELDVGVRDPVDDPATDVELQVTANGGGWGTYAVSIQPVEGGTVVDVETTSDRRFGLRRLPQRVVATRLMPAALEAQGYQIVERDASLSI